MPQNDDLTSLISHIIAVVQTDQTTPQPVKDTICNGIMVAGILLKDIHRIADAIEKISEEI